MSRCDVAYWYRVPDNPSNNPDCLIVLSYAVKDANSPSKPTQAALDLAYRWWKRHPKAKVIVSTGDNQRLGATNAAVMKGYLLSLGIPGKSILLEDRSMDTYQNLQYSREIIRRYGYVRPLFVLYDLHTRRAIRVARKMGWKDFRWVSATGPGGPSYGWKRFQTWNRTTILLYELLAFAYNAIRRQV